MNPAVFALLLQSLLSRGPSGGIGSFMGGLGAGGMAGMLMPPWTPPIRHNIAGDMLGGPGQMIARDTGQFVSRNVQSVATAGLLAAAGGPIGMIAGVGVLFETIVKNGLELPSMIKRWAESLKDSQRYLSEYNATIAVAFAKSDVRSIMRGMESGRATSGSTSDLVSALDSLKDTLRPLSDVSTNILNTMVTAAIKGTDTLLARLSAIPALKKLGDDIEGLLKLSRVALGMWEKEETPAAIEYMNWLRSRPESETGWPRR